ncbi:MAG: fatty acid-binding protein DegV [Firmicutes bacterium HGW-Firmicutes-12]|jgi:DegV family protein with EDD domain|nr:MAG: fatty acid-binding protein DegV [Firmicutes bacterium HGW-Firmicutes-12]
MNDIVILTDSSSDLPRSFIDTNIVPYFSLICHFKGQEFQDDFGLSINYKEFYDAIREKEMPSTSQVNIQTYLDKFRSYTDKGISVIYIGFSSALSGSLQSALLAKKMVMDENEDADITVIDSMSASLGQGLLVYYAYEMQKNRATKDEIVSWVEDNKLKMNHWFTVDSLDHLKRGGRISSTAAAVGSILNIKPILKIDNEGKLLPFTKVKGRKKSLRLLADLLKERIVAPEEQVIAISHSDCLDEVNYLLELLNDYSFKDIIINQIGQVIGSHVGPGTIGLYFIGENR